jgi:hypothetical protein
MDAIPANIAVLTFLEDNERVQITLLRRVLSTTPWVKDLLLVELRAEYPELPVDHPFAELQQMLDSYYQQVLPEDADLVTAGPCLVKLSSLLEKVNQRAERTVAIPGISLLREETILKITTAYHDRTFLG